jgi:hypothetical protein
MDKKVRTIQQLQTLQELFPIHIISAIADDHGWVANTTNITFKIECEDVPNYNNISLYLESEDLLYDLADNIGLIDPRIMDTQINPNQFDYQYDRLDGIFQAICVLNKQYPGVLKRHKSQIIEKLQMLSALDPDENFIFAQLLREIQQGNWRSNVYFDKY